MLNYREVSGVSETEIGAIPEYLCLTAEHQMIFFLWRPGRGDPKDDMVLELAVAAEADVIVTHNTRDFAGASGFGVTVLTPLEFLESLRGNP